MIISKKVLIVTPDLKILGGVANHYLGLKKHWSSGVKYITYGRRKSIPAIIMLPIDLLNYILYLVFKRPDVVIINPSLRYYQLFRDVIYLIIAKLMMIDVITFFHGWDEKVILEISKKPLLFRNTYGKSKFIYVLAKKFKTQLKELNLKSPIVLTTTKVDDKLLENFDVNSRPGEISNLLFLARVEISKGIIITINAFEKASKKFDFLTLTIVGAGGSLEEAKLYVLNKKIKNVYFKGALSGHKLIKEFKKESIYILPTYGEGMPTSVLEAMAFGLPIITRPVGGLNDFFEENKMGNLIKSLDPTDFSLAINELIRDREKCKNISIYNNKYSSKHFLASIVARNIENDIIKLTH